MESAPRCTFSIEVFGVEVYWDPPFTRLPLLPSRSWLLRLDSDTLSGYLDRQDKKYLISEVPVSQYCIMRNVIKSKLPYAPSLIWIKTRKQGDPDRDGIDPSWIREISCVDVT